MNNLENYLFTKWRTLRLVHLNHKFMHLMASYIFSEKSRTLSPSLQVRIYLSMNTRFFFVPFYQINEFIYCRYKFIESVAICHFSFFAFPSSEYIATLLITLDATVVSPASIETRCWSGCKPFLRIFRWSSIIFSIRSCRSLCLSLLHSSFLSLFSLLSLVHSLALFLSSHPHYALAFDWKRNENARTVYLKSLTFNSALFVLRTPNRSILCI